jgi:2-methylisocitrate lyase-like PEP mutase family enzyme
LDSLNLLHMLKRGSPAFGENFDSSLASVAWRIGVSVGGSTSADMARARKFADAGADLFFSSSLDGVTKLRELTDKPILLSVHEEAQDVVAILRQAQSAGATGIHVIVNAQAFNESTAGKRQ